MKNTLEEELNASYNLVKKTFQSEFPRPSLYAGDEYGAKFKGISSLRDLGHNSLMIYNEELNGIFVSTNLLRESHPLSEEELKIERTYIFLHEVAHALVSHKNPKLRENNVLRLINSGLKLDVEKGFVYNVLSEGLANYVAIQCCLKSGEESLKRRGEKEHKSLYDSFYRRASSESVKFTAKLYSMDSTRDWKKLALKYFEQNLDALLCFKYTLGYAFVSAIHPQNVEAIIDSPPNSIKHLIYPERYIREFEIKNPTRKQK